MVRIGLVCLAVALLASCALSPTPAVTAKQIALTFDDAPLPDGPILNGPERARRVVEGLQAAGVRQAAFFANPGRNVADRDARLRTYTRAGHVVANHTSTHPNLREVTAEAYLAEVRAADAVLRRMPNFRPWFRFPNLSEGETVEKRDAVRQGLIALGYGQGYVTADSADWRIDQLMRAAAQQGKQFDLAALRQIYIAAALQDANYADRMARATLGRAPRQVLLLHENDLAALFIVDLVRALREDGWTIITADDAFADPIAAELPDTLNLGGGRVAALMHANQLEARFPEPRRRLADIEADFAARAVR